MFDSATFDLNTILVENGLLRRTILMQVLHHIRIYGPIRNTYLYTCM